MYKRSSIRLRTDFSSETLQAKRQYNDICKGPKDKKKKPCQPRVQ
jgi:hypothetical protein